MVIVRAGCAPFLNSYSAVGEFCQLKPDAVAAQRVAWPSPDVTTQMMSEQHLILPDRRMIEPPTRRPAKRAMRPRFVSGALAYRSLFHGEYRLS